MFYLNCSSAGGAFVKGLNTVIVPRAVLLESSLNYTLFHPETVGSGHVLNGTSFSITDANEEQASSHIIAVISKGELGNPGEGRACRYWHGREGSR